MDYNAVLNRVRPMLTNGNHLSAQGFEALFGSCSQQEQEHLLAELAVLGILVDTSTAIPSSRKAASFCRSDFTSKQLWSMTNEQLCVLAQQGDESAKEILVRKTAGFVHLMARRGVCPARRYPCAGVPAHHPGAEHLLPHAAARICDTYAGDAVRPSEPL